MELSTAITWGAVSLERAQPRSRLLGVLKSWAARLHRGERPTLWQLANKIEWKRLYQWVPGRDLPSTSTSSYNRHRGILAERLLEVAVPEAGGASWITPPIRVGSVFSWARDTLVVLCESSRRHIQRAVKAAKAEGWLEQIRAPGDDGPHPRTACRYRINVRRLLLMALATEGCEQIQAESPVRVEIDPAAVALCQRIRPSWRPDDARATDDLRCAAAFIAQHGVPAEGALERVRTVAMTCDEKKLAWLRQASADGSGLLLVEQPWAMLQGGRWRTRNALVAAHEAGTCACHAAPPAEPTRGRRSRRSDPPPPPPPAPVAPAEPKAGEVFWAGDDRADPEATLRAVRAKIRQLARTRPLTRIERLVAEAPVQVVDGCAVFQCATPIEAACSAAAGPLLDLFGQTVDLVVDGDAHPLKPRMPRIGFTTGPP